MLGEGRRTDDKYRSLFVGFPLSSQANVTIITRWQRQLDSNYTELEKRQSQAHKLNPRLQTCGQMLPQGDKRVGELISQIRPLLLVIHRSHQERLEQEPLFLDALGDVADDLIPDSIK